jgi:hypothetical protein
MDIKPKHKTAAFTVCASNYFGKALVLQQSYLKHHPQSDFYILIVDKKHPRLDPQESGARILWVEDLEIEGFPHYAFKFDIVELSTNVKPGMMRILLGHYDQVLYLDPDTCVYSELSPVFDALGSNSIVVTPHALTPEETSDREFLRFGSFNLGFLGVSKCEEGFKFLDWWSERCLGYGYTEPQLGLSVDQKWIDLAPSFFPGLKILRDPGLNVAPWNLHERTIAKRDGAWMVNEEYPLRFFHFSSFKTTDPHGIAHRQTQLAPARRLDLEELLDGHADCLRKNGDERYSRETYSFDYFDDGLYVSRTLRRFYAALESKFPREENPFAHKSAVQRFAASKGLVKKDLGVLVRPKFSQVGEYSRAINTISFLLRNVLRVIGPNRYFLLMNYMAYISSIRNQRDLFPNLRVQHSQE